MNIKCYVFNDTPEPSKAAVIQDVPGYLVEEANRIQIEFHRVKAPASESNYLVEFKV